MDPEKILVVDDDETLMYMMTSHLERQGYSVEGTVDPFQGLETIKTKGPFAVLVTDLMMPYMDGIQLLRKARQFDPRMEVVVITAVASVQTAIAAMREDGAYNYLIKPLENINELSLAVKRAARYRQLQLEREVLQARALAEAERLQLLISNISDAILAADAQGMLTVINPAASRLLGRDNLLSHNALASLPRPLATLLSNWHATGGQRPAVIEITWPGSATQMVSLTPIVNSIGDFNGWVMVIRDISHLKQLDELKMQLLTETANKVRLPLVQAMNLLTELSNPASVPAERTSDIVYRLVKIWKRVQNWADDILTLAQYESGSGITTTTVNPSQILTDAITGLSQEPLQAKRLRLDVNVPPNLSSVQADPVTLRKTIQGLIIRAIARSEAGGTIRMVARQQERQIWIDISDEGTPIAGNDLPHVFERSFVGVDGGYDDTGLELATAKTIIDKLGGQVWVSSPGPVGSTITICLPTIADPALPDAAAAREM
jgi:two-component system sensor histidine kinase ResE